MNLVIGSGDIVHLLMGKQTKGYQDFIRKFVAEDKPYYNALSSPIDALRTGAILEERYALIIPDDYYCQYKCKYDEMDVFVSSIDFARINNGNIVDFDELKTMFLIDYLEMIEPIKNADKSVYLPIIKKSFGKYYNQVQCQLMCSGLDEANLVFLSVDSYKDEENYNRNILESDYAKFRIYRDEKVISEIKNRGQIFQDIKNHLK